MALRRIENEGDHRCWPYGGADVNRHGNNFYVIASPISIRHVLVSSLACLHMTGIGNQASYVAVKSQCVCKLYRRDDSSTLASRDTSTIPIRYEQMKCTPVYHADFQAEK